ncbi:hypothetical protein HDU79_000373, partial [Rhizoclosmatium sp. JEL0117]
MTFDIDIYERLQNPEDKAAYMALVTLSDEGKKAKIEAKERIAEIRAAAANRMTRLIHDDSDSDQTSDEETLDDASQNSKTVEDLNHGNVVVLYPKLGLETLFHQ